MTKQISRSQFGQTSEITESNKSQPNPASQKTERPMASERANDSPLGVATNMASATTDHSYTSVATAMVPPMAVKPAKKLNPVAARISPFQPGLQLVSVSSPPILPLVRTAFTCLATENGRELGIPMPIVEEVVSVFSGSPRQLEQAQLFAVANPPATSSIVSVTKRCAAPEKLDWTNYGGQYALLPIIEDAKGWVIIEQTTVGAITPAFLQGLIQIDHAAKQAGTWVMLLIAGSDRADVSQLTHVCGDLIEVAQCEPDVDCDTAFSIDCVGIRDLNSLGVGKTMCNVQLIDSVFHRRYTRFVSADLETRIMCELRGQQKSLDEIGSIFKINKSTVFRRLQGLPIPRPEEVDQDWLDRNLEALPSKSS